LSLASRSDRSAGFSLLEVLVSLAIVAAVLGAIGMAIGTTVRGTRNIDQRLTMTETGQILLASIPDRGLLRSGTLRGELGGFRWRMDVTPAPAGSDVGTKPGWQPLAILLRLQHDNGPVLQLTTYRLIRAAAAN
jgi:general secretion pathway protein I